MIKENLKFMLYIFNIKIEKIISENKIFSLIIIFK